MHVKSTLPTHSKPGFAIIVTVSILVLLAVVAVGLLTLSTVTVRTASQGSALAEARANAKLAMVIAIGELQKQAGPDQRITASGAVLDETPNHPHWTGVWDSWKAGDLTSGGDTASDHATIPSSKNPGLSPSYEEGREGHFRSWLVSTTKAQQEALDSAQSLDLSGSLSPDTRASAVKLVGEGTLASAPDQNHISAGLTGLEPNSRLSGRIGWWVGDESQKARIAADSRRNDWDRSMADQIFRAQAPGNTGFQTLDAYAELTDEESLERIISNPSTALIDGVDANAAKEQFHSLTPFSYGVLSDVREGGLKRDLSALLERPINTRETADDFMLYRFNRRKDWVPVQDLAAYYQLYRNQVKYSSRLLRSGIQTPNINFGSGRDEFTRAYTNLYQLPIPIKVQFLLSLTAEPRTAAEKRNNPRNRDTHKLNIGISPAVTLWNPNSTPLVMNPGSANATQMRFFNMPLAIKWTKGGYTSPRATSLAWIANGAVHGGDRDTGFTVFFSGNRPVVFEPGQVRVFSLANTSLRELRNSNVFRADREVVAGWNPDTYIQMMRSDRSNNAQHIEPPNNDRQGALTFRAGDRISFSIEPTEVTDLANGSALQFFHRQSSVSAAKRWMDRHYQMVSRLKGANTDFNRKLMAASFPGEATRMDFEAQLGSDIISGPVPFLVVNLAAGCETHESASVAPFAGRHFPSRPFLHSTPITGTVFIDDETDDGAYHHGWNWWVEDINSPFDANISIDPDNNGYYGGGYTSEHGATNIVQQEIPVAPPISIAALSHAHLGGFSLANSNLGAGASNTTTAFQGTTASGQGGLFPHTLQAIGNSYAHPHLAPDAAHGTITRKFSETVRAQDVVFADHSYLANKALWDEYFFSSISPSRTRAFAGADSGTALDAAKQFFLADSPLPNHRFTPYTADLDEDKVSSFFSRASLSLTGADQVSSHMLVEGPFNINSTSVNAWRSLFSSLKGKNVPYLDPEKSLSNRLELDSEPAEGTPISSFSLPNGKPYQGSRELPSDADQWIGWRDLSDQEITELAEAMVEQVRKRGPFLSLSEFVNRRLDSSDKDLALKGALQAALDDPDVSINSAFRDPDRRFSASEISRMNPKFPEALEGPVAYGSAAYVDQADVLRNFAGQLTPRGDTFVIRTYGDSVDGGGTVRARAWCEAVVQRVPEYLEGEDLPHLKQDELTSLVNQTFGRRIRVVSFRFLNSTEI